MSVHASYIEEEERLDLTFEGNLDVTVSRDVCDICQRAASGLQSCIVDLSNVERMFDSGVALLQMLHQHLEALGTTVVILSDRPEIREKVSLIACKHGLSQHLRAPKSSYWSRTVLPKSHPV